MLWYILLYFFTPRRRARKIYVTEIAIAFLLYCIGPYQYDYLSWEVGDKDQWIILKDAIVNQSILLYLRRIRMKDIAM
jgi:hypothetical protein